MKLLRHGLCPRVSQTGRYLCLTQKMFSRHHKRMHCLLLLLLFLSPSCLLLPLCLPSPLRLHHHLPLYAQTHARPPPPLHSLCSLVSDLLLPSSSSVICLLLIFLLPPFAYSYLAVKPRMHRNRPHRPSFVPGLHTHAKLSYRVNAHGRKACFYHTIACRIYLSLLPPLLHRHLLCPLHHLCQLTTTTTIARKQPTQKK